MTIEEKRAAIAKMPTIRMQQFPETGPEVFPTYKANLHVDKETMESIRTHTGVLPIKIQEIITCHHKSCKS